MKSTIICYQIQRFTCNWYGCCFQLIIRWPQSGWWMAIVTKDNAWSRLPINLALNHAKRWFWPFGIIFEMHWFLWLIFQRNQLYSNWFAHENLNDSDSMWTTWLFFLALWEKKAHCDHPTQFMKSYDSLRNHELCNVVNVHDKYTVLPQWQMVIFMFGQNLLSVAYSKIYSW